MSELNVKAVLRFLSLVIGFCFVAGCGTFRDSDPNPQDAFVFPDEKTGNESGDPKASAAPPTSGGVRLNVGELVTVTFSDIPPPGILERRERIRDDGRITLPYNVSVVAAGKTAAQVEREIRDEYVPRLFPHLTITVRPEERWYFVGGQVRNSARFPYSGRLTVLRAIDAAGGFNDFANKKKIELRRASGEKPIIVNWHKAVENPRYDPPVYPDDQIIVHRKFW